MLLYAAMCGEVPTRGTMIDKIVFREEALGTCVVAIRELHLSQPEGILRVIYVLSVY